MRARAALLVVALVAALVGLGQPAVASAVTTSPAPTPKVVGNTIVDTRTNAVWVPHGANWPSFEYACAQGWAYSQDDDTNAAAAAMQSWGINIVRVPLNEDCWLGSDSSDFGTSTGYRAAVAAWVGILNAHGIVVILDLHWSAPPGQHALGQWPMPDSQSTGFWSSVAGAYAGNPSVIFDAFNEPYSIWNDATGSYTFQLTWKCWRDGGCKAPLVDDNQTPLPGTSTYTVVGMSAIVAAIRGAGATQPIMLGGLNYSNDLSSWNEYKPVDSQLIASWHNYPGQDSCGYTPTCWTAATADVINSVPIITGEFGETDGGSSAMTAYMNWADAHGIGYLPWAWWSADGLTGDAALYALIQGTNFTPHAPTGTNYKAHLAALTPTKRVFHTLPTPITLPLPGGTVSTSSSPAAVTAIAPAQLDELALSTQRSLRIAAHA